MQSVEGLNCSACCLRMWLSVILVYVFWTQTLDVDVVISGGYRIVLYNHAVFELDHFQKRFVKLRLCCMLLLVHKMEWNIVWAGTVLWTVPRLNISQTLEVIDFLETRYS
jgi:hypothetical protein